MSIWPLTFEHFFSEVGAGVEKDLGTLQQYRKTLNMKVRKVWGKRPMYTANHRAIDLIILGGFTPRLIP